MVFNHMSLGVRIETALLPGRVTRAILLCRLILEAYKCSLGGSLEGVESNIGWELKKGKKFLESAKDGIHLSFLSILH